MVESDCYQVKDLSQLNDELSKDREFDQSFAREKLHAVSSGLANMEKELEEFKSGSSLAEKIAKLELRNFELEQALKIKESAIEKLSRRNAQLEKDLKAKDTLRMSQLELLALRNCELEKEITRTVSSCPSDVAS